MILDKYANPEFIYNQYKTKIYNLAYRMTGNRDDAADITHETFVQAFKSLDKFKGESQLYTWLYTIAKNNCLKFLENKKRTTFQSLQTLMEQTSSPVSEDIPEADKANYIVQVKEGCLSGLLRCLPLTQRLAFIFHVLLDVPVEQVATITGKSENATRILVHRSRQNIKEFLCKHCSLYDSGNMCRCENLINISLRQGWIKQNETLNVRLETEIKSLKNVISLYKTLHEATPTDDVNKKIQNLVTGKTDLLIFADKKVK
jgi:RNA polymerase sigma-70 factor (ECF subfamily)